AQAEARSALADAYRTTARAGDPSPLAGVAGAHDVDDVVAGGAAQRAVDRKNARAVTAQADVRATAENADARWDAARTELAEAKEQARTAFEAAQDAAATLTARTAAAEDERDRLYARLAQLRSTSVELEREREQARQEQAERARERAAREAVVAQPTPGDASGGPAADAGEPADD
ncbi:NlpC/P60 family protein, partial [Isoptericola cucumis]